MKELMEGVSRITQSRIQVISFVMQVKEILELSPSLLSAPDVLLGLCNMKTSEGRKLCAKALCNNI